MTSQITYENDIKIYSHYNDDGQLIAKLFYYKDNQNNYHIGLKNKPTAILYKHDSIVTMYFVNYLSPSEYFHNSYGPAIIVENLNNEVIRKKWYYEGIEYTNDVNNYLMDHHLKNNIDYDLMWDRILVKNANKNKIEIIQDENEKLITHTYNNRYHRNYKDGPAFIIEDNDGNIIKECYFKHGELHNEYGPAYIYGDDIKWFIYGIDCTEIVNQYLNGIDYLNMSHEEFNKMWVKIL